MGLPRSVFLCVGVCAFLLPAQQPIQFPHNKHIGFGMDCIDCHSTADTRAAATIPSVQKCMLCHAKLGKDKPAVKQVIEYAEKKREIPWKRVYGFEASAMVRFRHAPHVRAGVGCATCHGDMTKAIVAEPLVKHTMGTCLTCHRQKGAPEDCTTCHF